MPTQGAGVVTITDEGYKMGCKDPLEARLGDCRLEPACGTDLHAHTASRASGEELRFGPRSGRSDKTRMVDRGLSLRCRPKQR